MKKIKVFLLLFFLLLLTGCSGTYNLKINQDYTVDEEIKLTIPAGNDNYNKTLKLFEENKIDKDKYNVVASDKNVKITYKDKFDSLDDYLVNNKIYKNFFDEVDYSRDRNSILINTTSKLNLSGIKSNNINSNYDISLLQINIEYPNKVIYDNADINNKNISSWVLKKDTTSKKIYLKISAVNAKENIGRIVVLGTILLVILFSALYFIKNSKKQNNF